ncbi:hypothetical protein STRATTON_288 [Erwinia phage vB_EamM_Stratton]|uniref:Uncharacterized protein n=1 Tax=Erwinia phage vB_EamM_Stratton TaxID=1883378 RepID=A0A1B2IHK5_9CAUD|nr:hypothetical protein STRATTON_288 [Erwinia phage vB_EamM_Stratton]
MVCLVCSAKSVSRHFERVVPSGETLNHPPIQVSAFCNRPLVVMHDAFTVTHVPVPWQLQMRDFEYTPLNLPPVVLVVPALGCGQSEFGVASIGVCV